MKLIKLILLTSLAISSNSIAETCAPTYGQEREKFQIAIIDDWPEHVTCVYSAETMYEKNDPYSVFYRGKPVEFSRENGKTIVKLKLPFADKKNLRLYNRSGELVVEVENWKRIMYLPETMANLQPENAEFKNGYLYITLS